MLMISPDDIMSGQVDEVLTDKNLARLYQFPIEAIETDTGRIFLPGSL